MNKFIIIFYLLPLFCLSQKQGNIWYFGINAGLDFNASQPVFLTNGQTYPYPYGWNEGCSSICDSSGTLLFYTNGMKLWDNQHQILPNGDNLMGNASSTQSSIIVPQPGSSRYFYIFTTDALENNFQNGLRYSVIDICLNGGFGDVTEEKNIKLLDTVSERLICIKHSNGTDYWIVTHKFNSDAFYSFKLSSNGIIDTIISHTGTVDNIGWGQTVISNNRLKISITAPSAINGFTLLLDFDPSTGIISNEQTLSSGSRIYGVSFSPDNSKLYCSAIGVGEIYQYDLNAGNLAAIIASKTYIVQNEPDEYRQQKLGPNGKIYISMAGKLYLSSIEFPDSLYPACNYIDSAIYLGGKYASFGLPNFIGSYDYSNTVFQDCISVEAKGENDFEKVAIFPNPFSCQTTIQIGKILKDATLILYNPQGQQIKQLNNISEQTVTLYRENLASGLYFLQLIKDNQTFTTHKLIITDLIQ